MSAPPLPRSLADNPVLGRWVGFEPGGRVRLATGKVEIGQGILTALAQIAAEELDVPPDRIRVVSGDTDTAPAEGFTSGSNSTAVSGGSIRLACAEVRALFLATLAGELGCDPGDLSVEEGRFLRDGQPTNHDYWTLAARVDLEREATGRAPVKAPADYRVVGASVPRVDFGRVLSVGGFIHDIAPPGLLHARVLHRPWAGARLAGIDEAAVVKAGGGRIDIDRDGDALLITGDDEVAVMRAHAAARERARWEGGTPIPDEADRLDWLTARPKRSRVVETGKGDAPEGPAIEAVFTRPYLTHGSIAPSCGLARFSDGHLTVETHSQGVHVLRDWLARSFGLDVSAVTVVHRQGAGCYGHNSADDAAFEAAFVAMRHPGRHVRVQWAREEEFTAASVGPAQGVRLAAVVDEAGRPADWTIELWSPVHGRRPGMNGRSNFLLADAASGAEPEPDELADVPDGIGGGATRNAVAYYDLPRHRMIHHILDGVPLRASTLRGLGAHLNTFAIEGFLDNLAEMAGEDPVAYRLAIVRDERQRRVIEEAAAMSGWPGTDEPGSGRAMGFGFGRYKNTAAYMAAVAEVEVEEEVRVTRVWAAVDTGLVVNPDGAANQVEGGIVQAVSWTLKERLRFAEGRVVSDNWGDYPILRFTEVPEIEIRFTGTPDMPTLGIGETAVGPTAAALGNAVARALGARIRDLPLSRERIMETLLA